MAHFLVLVIVCAGYRKYLGAICEKEVIVLVDVSSSVTMYLPEIKEAMTSLLDNMPIKIRRSEWHQRT